MLGLERFDVESNNAYFMFLGIDHLRTLQRQRHITFWHDGSTISNHSHLLIVVVILYDNAVFYSNDEYFLKTGKLDRNSLQSFIFKYSFIIFINCLLLFIPVTCGCIDPASSILRYILDIS